MNIEEITFSHNDKLNLAEKIKKIKKKKYLIKILNMIRVDNNVYDINNNGLFIFFHKLTNSTYNKIDEYVNKIYNKHTKKKISIVSKEYSENDKVIPDYEFMNDFNNDNYASFSNREKIILRKKNYDNYINNNRDD